MYKLKNIVFALFLGCFTTTQAQQLLDSLTLDTLTATTSLVEALKNPDAVIKLELKKQKLKSTQEINITNGREQVGRNFNRE